MVGVIIGLLMFMFLITFHELGHFIGAKSSNIKVNEFSIGMGPSIYSKQKGETKYSLRALPIGGYVSMEGEDEESEDERGFNNSSKLARFITILAGPFMNFLTAFVLFLIIFSRIGTPSTSISNVIENYPAIEAGLQKDDIILKVDDNHIKSQKDFLKKINESEGKEVNIEVLRGENNISLKVKPKQVEGHYLIGIEFNRDYGFLNIVKHSFVEIKEIVVITWNALTGLFTGNVSFKELSGPIGVIKVVGENVKYGLNTILMFTAIISINLGFFNLLPIPALDGSKLLFIIVEAIIGKPINKKFEQTITIVGFIALMALILVVSVKDVLFIFK